MEILLFISGFALGVIVVFFLLLVFKKQLLGFRSASEEQMKISFENLANKILSENSASFSEKNAEKLEEFFKIYKEYNQLQNNQSKERLDDFYKNFKEKIEQFQKQAQDNLKTSEEKFLCFDMNIKSFLEAGNKISHDTTALVNVMKSDNRTQGKWGEIVLEKVLESSGLRREEEYRLQSGTSEGRPDAEVCLPEGRVVYIDAKTSISSWDKYLNAESEDEKSICLKEFITSTKHHITTLAQRDYSKDDMSPDYVLMFIPIESCYSMMFCEDCSLWDYAWKNKIMPVSPSTLLAALKIINAFHVVDRQNKNAIEISRLCAGMLDKFAALLADLLKIKTSLETSLKKLNGTGNILRQIEKIEKLGIVMTKKIPELPEDLSEDLSEE